MKTTAKITAVLLVLALAGSTSARVITVEVEGVVDSVSVGGRFALDGSVGVGSTMTAFCTYDTETPVLGSGSYAVISISMTIGNYIFTHDPMSPDPAFFHVYTVDPGYIVNSDAPRFDGIIYVDGVPRTFDDITWEEPYGRVTLMDVFTSLDGIITSTELPTSFPDISVFDLRREFGIGFVEPSTIPNGGGFVIEGELTYLGVVPEPPKTYYVDAAEGSDNNDGLSPQTPFATIQKAIDSAFDGDTVIVADGTYTGPGNRYIDFLGKAITVRSESGPENCIVDCNGTEDYPHRGFYFHSGEDKNSIVDGLTITNGHGPEEDIENHWISRGGAILCSASSPTIINCTIIDNAGDDRGGGICCTDNSSPTIENCTITGNSADFGAGIYCDANSSPTISKCTITGNRAPTYYGSYTLGGGIYCRDSNPFITNCTISGNYAATGDGVYCGASSPMITNCIISENTTWDHSNGIYCEDNSSPTITNCFISENHRGIYCEHSSPMITGCTITRNWAEWGPGGGIFCIDSSPKITNSTISGNTAEWGAGIYCHYGSTTISSCTISRNSARGEYAYGGGICCAYNTLIITNSTISGNMAKWGGGIDCHRSSPTIINSILWGNQAIYGPQIYLEDNSNASVSYADVQGDQNDVYIGQDCTLDWGIGNIDADPCFVVPGYWDANDTPDDVNDDFWVEGDYHLLPTSPCIDAGDPNYVAEPNETDLDGNPRVSGDAIDMGAYEAIMHEARLLIFPRVINRHSRQRKILAWLRLPEGITRDQIDRDTPLVLYPGGSEAIRQFVFQYRRRGSGRTSIFAFFDKAELMDAVGSNGRVQLQVLGYLIAPGRYFYATDTIKIKPRR